MRRRRSSSLFLDGTRKIKSVWRNGESTSGLHVSLHFFIPPSNRHGRVQNVQRSDEAPTATRVLSGDNASAVEWAQETCIVGVSTSDPNGVHHVSERYENAKADQCDE